MANRAVVYCRVAAQDSLCHIPLADILGNRCRLAIVAFVACRANAMREECSSIYTAISIIHTHITIAGMSTCAGLIARDILKAKETEYGH